MKVALLAEALGTVPAKTGGAFSKGDLLEVDASGRLVPQTDGVAVARAAEDSIQADEMRRVRMLSH